MTAQGPLFEETQPWWINRFLRAFMPLESMILGMILLAVGSQSSPRDQWIMLGVWLGLGLLLPAAFLCWRLKTSVTPDTLRVRFAGLPGWRIPLERVESAEVIKVDPLRDFGGWGYRGSRKFGRVYNVWGDRAVLVTLTDGGKRTIGTQRPEELAAAVLAGAIGEPGSVVRA